MPRQNTRSGGGTPSGGGTSGGVGDARGEDAGGAGGERFSFEAALDEVERIVRRMESGEVGLEESLAEYERGVQLTARCRAVLERVEQRVVDLTRQMQASGRGGDAGAGEGGGAAGPGGGLAPGGGGAAGAGA